jgi:hypothetical protein
VLALQKTVRATWLLVLIAGLLAGCVAEPGASPAVVSICTTGYANRIDIHLSNPDNGRSSTAHLCDAIDVLLVGPPSSQWQSIDSSDEAVLMVLPLPLPAPPPGGAHDIYLAHQTGTTVLSSVNVTANPCASPGCLAVHWSVRVTVTG